MGLHGLLQERLYFLTSVIAQKEANGVRSGELVQEKTKRHYWPEGNHYRTALAHGTTNPKLMCAVSSTAVLL
jgi:hypothetical protein